mmetsp:Transcript_17561/g.52855  ORF Transcript_17561/g.52855 Transcript_17561/m.52855 type:complete len:211 (-) Transcript_17561:116-748(-)
MSRAAPVASVSESSATQEASLSSTKNSMSGRPAATWSTCRALRRLCRRATYLERPKSQCKILPPRTVKRHHSWPRPAASTVASKASKSSLLKGPRCSQGARSFSSCWSIQSGVSVWSASCRGPRQQSTHRDVKFSPSWLISSRSMAEPSSRPAPQQSWELKAVGQQQNFARFASSCRAGWLASASPELCRKYRASSQQGTWSARLGQQKL